MITFQNFPKQTRSPKLSKVPFSTLCGLARSFSVVLFSPQERHTEEVHTARGGSVESLCCLGRKLYDISPTVLNQ